MKRSFKLENLDCANCAAKMEANINKIEGVEANISFMTARLTIEDADEYFEEVLEMAQKAIAKVDSDCRIVR